MSKFYSRFIFRRPARKHRADSGANWEAEYLLKLVWIGMPVEVVP